MSFFILCLLCVVQGLTEFLPISSSGHLLLFEQLFGIHENTMLINLFLHLATLFAVIIYYRKIVWKIIKKPFQKYTMKLLLATAITVVLALIYEYFDIDRVATKIYPFGFLATSILLFVTHKFQQRAAVVNYGEISYKNSALVGFVQGLAVVPGLSRSGSTISAMMLSGNSKEESAEFSFLLSIPIIIGGFILEIVKNGQNLTNLYFSSVFVYVFAFILTFLVALASLKVMMKVLHDQKFNYFAIYTFVLFLITFYLNYIR